MKSGKGRVPLHQGMVRLMFLHEKDNGDGTVGSLQGGFPRSIISKEEEVVDGQGKKGPRTESKTNGRFLKQKPTLPKCWLPTLPSAGEEDENDGGKSVEASKCSKVINLGSHGRGSSLESFENSKVVEELKGDLKILNGLGGPLMSTCACINLLVLELPII
eukprot:Gb_10349 [translate_table: standard]